MSKKLSGLYVLLLLTISCVEKQETKRLVHLDTTTTGIDFVNRITENDSINVVKFQYCYNGGGVGIGDFNKDGKPDVVLTGNQVSSRIYLNKGELSFEDISEKANFKTNSWVTGVSIVDINADGWDDIYLNVGGANCKGDCENLLFVNQGTDENGVPAFTERAKAYGLNDGNYAQQSVFFDYDGDGDLDVYILHNGNSGIDKNNPVPKQYMPPHLKDWLLRNDTTEGVDHPIFTNISEEAGIVHGGFGLGIGINDFNNDGLTDIYVANDFITEDLLYIQKRHADSLQPWFEEKSKQYLGHETYNAMGMDFQDADNDSRPDIMVVDMLPMEYERQKKMLGMMNYEKYLLAQRNDYSSQYVHNTLQLNNGKLRGQQLMTSEVGFMKGISSTDWSWAPLLIDLDNDADKDLYISNGYVKDVADLDYINYSGQNNMFGTREERTKKQIEFTKHLDSIYLPNFIYENDGTLGFTDVSNTWTNERPSYSNGIAYADLDTDGDLDLVVNNINEPAFVLENTTSNYSSKNHLRLQLKGIAKNPHAIGAKVTLWNQGKPQHHFQSVVRGYLSSMEPIVHFGVKDSIIDSLQVKWPNGKTSILKEVVANQVLALHIENAKELPSFDRPEKLLFHASSGLIDFKHDENEFNEYNQQRLLMRQHSQMGPCLAVGNIDGETGDELFIGGSVGRPGQIWKQNNNGVYEAIQKLESDYEDTDAVFVDIDGDGDLDLYVTSGSTEFRKSSENYQDRLYQNDGTGVFTRDIVALPESFESSHCIRASDIDQDGDIDFFIGSRVVPGNYPNHPKNVLLFNDNGRFSEKTDSKIDMLGMVTDAVWEDVDKDGWEDLVVVGEWMPIQIFKNHKGSLRKMKVSFSNDNDQQVRTEGWWNCIAPGDFDGDGDIDFLVGNQGLNGYISPSQEHPLYVYKKDFDQNGSPDPILGHYMETTKGLQLLPVHTRDDIVAQLVSLKKRYRTYEDFVKVDFEGLLNIQNLNEETLQAYTFASSYMENLGDGHFRLIPLPDTCQSAPINKLLVHDFGQDGLLDALAVGNDFSAETLYGKADALTGLFLKGTPNGFEVIKSTDSGFYVPGQSHKIDTFTDLEGSSLIIATQNKDSLKVFSWVR